MKKPPNKIDQALIKRQIERAKELPRELLRCRVGGERHHWDQVRPDWEPSNAALPLAYQCQHCWTVKRMDVDPKYGFIVGRPSYEYPPNYKLKRGDEAEQVMSPQAVRFVTATEGYDLKTIQSTEY